MNDTKQCFRCKEDKPLSEFHKRKGGLNPVCKICRKDDYDPVRARELYDARKEEIQEDIDVFLAYIDRLKRDTGCADCGTKEGLLHFHHLDKQTKVTNVGQMWSYSKESLTAEIAKCVVLCASCHSKRHV